MSNIEKGKKKGGQTVAIVTELAQPIVDELNLTLWDVRFEKEGSSWFLRIIIDKEDGVSTDDCEAVSRPLDKKLDEVDPIEQSYYLEVASAGLGRLLVKPWHFEQYIGKEIRIRFIRVQDGVIEVEGILLGFDDGIIRIQTTDDETSLNLSDCAYVKVNDDKFI